jgi:hypothetical protein
MRFGASLSTIPILLVSLYSLTARVHALYLLNPRRLMVSVAGALVTNRNPGLPSDTRAHEIRSQPINNTNPLGRDLARELSEEAPPGF